VSIFENLAVSNQHSAKAYGVCDPLPTEQLEPANNGYKSVRSAIDFTRKMPSTARSTVLSNWDLIFVFNKGSMGGGVMAEGRRQRDAKEIAKIAETAKIEN
jgi:hypothetical protein